MQAQSPPPSADTIGTGSRSTATAYYDIEVLPGIGPTSSRDDLSETTGWHPDKDTDYLGIDIGASAQRDRFSWERIAALCERLWPRASILHPWPAERFAVTTQGRSRMP